MTDNTTTKEKDLEKEVISEKPVDAILKFMVTLSEGGVGLPVTLFVNGTIIAGNIISFEEYMKKITDDIRNSIDQGGVGPEKFQEITGIVADGLDTIRTAILQRDDDVDRRMIHLGKVRIVKPTGIPINPIGVTDLSNSVWRGPLSSIDGFILGILGGSS